MYNRFLIKDYNKGKYSTLEITSFHYITLNLYNLPFKVQYGNLRKKYGMLTYNFRNYKGKEYLRITFMRDKLPIYNHNDFRNFLIENFEYKENN